MLICGVLATDEDLLAEARRRLSAQLGPLELISPVWPFDFTDYYEPEMGTEIKRQFVTFKELMSVDRLPEIKRLTNAMELRFCDDLALPHATRPVNLDPGYLTHAKLVLATTKDASHRLYLGGGIFGEVTLHYKHGSWRNWPWTYIDYAGDTYTGFFEQARQSYNDRLGEVESA